MPEKQKRALMRKGMTERQAYAIMNSQKKKRKSKSRTRKSY